MTTAAPRDLGVAALLLVPVLAGAAFSLVRYAQETGDIPADAHYAAIAEAMEGQGFDADKDGLAVLPPWSLRPHVFLKRYRPMGSDQLGERPLHRYARLFVVLEPDHEPHSAALFNKHGRGELVAEAGPVQLVRYDFGEPRALFDLRARLRDAQVRLTDKDGDTVQACERWTGSAWRCGKRKDWQRVEAEWQLVSENGQRAIWAHPPKRAERLEIAWDDVPFGDGLVLRGGHTRTGADHARGPVEVEVWIGDEQLAALDYPPRFSFDATTLDTAKFKGRRDRLTLRIYTRRNGKQHWAFDGWTFAGGDK